MNVREWALPLYTILMQLAVGALFVLWVIRSLVSSKFTTEELGRVIRYPILVITVTGFLAMIGAHFHLSKPYHSYLALLNLGSSWLSREIFFTILFFVTTFALWYFFNYKYHLQRLITGLGWLAVSFGFILVYCMSRIYILPTQEVWNSLSVTASFFITTLLLGCMTIACLMVLDLEFAKIQASTDVEPHIRLIRYSFRNLSFLALGLAVLDMSITLIQISSLRYGDAAAQSSLRLLLELYLPLLIIHFIFLSYASLSLAYFVDRMYRQNSPPRLIMVPVYIASLLIFIGEIMGRFLFYAIHIRIGI